MSDGKFKTSRSGRLSKIINLSATVVGKSIAGVLTAKSEIETRVAQAKAIAETLSELKGAAMKLGQMLSIQGDHLLPPEVTDVLGKLQNAAPALSGEKIIIIAKNELGPKFEMFAEFNADAFAAASIGQVHRARLKTGEECALKIQYPGIADAIDSEISLVKTLLIPISKLYGGRIEFDSLAEELKAILKTEVDYTKELGFLRFFKEHLADSPQFVIPKTYDDLSTNRLLTMSYEDGLHLKDFIKTNPTQDERNRIALDIFILLMREIFEFRTVQTDPNFANYLFRINKSSPTQTVLLDFGSCKSYSADFIANYKQFGLFLIDDRKQAALDLAFHMGFLNPRESEETKSLFYEMCRLTLEPNRASGDFDYGGSDLLKRIQTIAIQFLKTLRHTPPPAEVLFLNRKLGGIYNLFRTLGVRFNFNEYHLKYLKSV